MHDNDLFVEAQLPVDVDKERARYGVRKCFHDTGGIEGCLPLIEGLRDRGDTGVADAGTGTSCSTGGLDKLEPAEDAPPACLGFTLFSSAQTHGLSTGTFERM